MANNKKKPSNHRLQKANSSKASDASKNTKFEIANLFKGKAKSALKPKLEKPQKSQNAVTSKEAMQKVTKNTSVIELPVPNWILIEPDTLSKIEDHAYSILDAEVGGMLFGSIENGTTTIKGMVPAHTKSVDQISLTFTHEVWERILSDGGRLFPDSTIIGWYHTHPSFGLFLSEYDAFIQRNFFGSKGQLALVIDPIEGSLGWFTLGQDDSIEKLGVAKTSRGASAKQVRESVQLAASRGGTISYGRAGALAAIGSLAFGLLGYGIAQAHAPVDLSAQVANQSYFLNRIQTGDIDYVYWVRKGDTWRSVSDFFYGTGQPTTLISNNNPDIKGELKPGQRINIFRPQIMAIDLNFVPPMPASTSSPSVSESPAAKNSPTPSTPSIQNNPIPSPSPTSQK